jgi:ribosome biogenesis GTPase A
MSAKTQTNVKKIIEMIVREYNPKFKTVGTWCMVGGIPNVGKSTIINTFKNISNDAKELAEESKKQAKIGIHATTTRYIDCFKVNLEPIIFIMDTPGIMPPKIYNLDSGMKLSICGNIKDKIAGKESICDYLLFHLNKHDHNQQAYMKQFRIKQPVFHGQDLVALVMKEFLMSSNNAYDYILRNFREGNLGKITFDENIPNELIYTKPNFK